jgi:hypothetical protein
MLCAKSALLLPFAAPLVLMSLEVLMGFVVWMDGEWVAVGSFIGKTGRWWWWLMDERLRWRW